jgi:hypothetical protein
MRRDGEANCWLDEQADNKEGIWTLRDGVSLNEIPLDVLASNTVVVQADARCYVGGGLLADPPQPLQPSGDDGDEGGYQIDVVVVVVAADGRREEDDSSTSNSGGDGSIVRRGEILTIPLWGANAGACSNTLSLLLRHECLGPNDDVTLKAFAKMPRQTLPAILTSSSCDGKNRPIALGCLRFHYVAIAQPDLFLPTATVQVHDTLEFRQCTVEHWSNVMKQQLQARPAEASTRAATLQISCSQPEFAKLTATVSECTVPHLHLVLHFWLQGGIMEAFCRSLAQNQTLETLHLQYLDLSDDTSWYRLLQSLPPTLQVLQCSYTDNFVDAHRRLTPERRAARTRAVLDLVQTPASGGTAATPTCLRQITYPECEQDPGLMHRVESILRERYE